MSRYDLSFFLLYFRAQIYDDIYALDVFCSLSLRYQASYLKAFPGNNPRIPVSHDSDFKYETFTKTTEDAKERARRFSTAVGNYG